MIHVYCTDIIYFENIIINDILLNIIILLLYNIYSRFIIIFSWKDCVAQCALYKGLYFSTFLLGFKLIKLQTFLNLLSLHQTWNLHTQLRNCIVILDQTAILTFLDWSSYLDLDLSSLECSLICIAWSFAPKS